MGCSLCVIESHILSRLQRFASLLWNVFLTAKREKKMCQQTMTIWVPRWRRKKPETTSSRFNSYVALQYMYNDGRRETQDYKLNSMWFKSMYGLRAGPLKMWADHHHGRKQTGRLRQKRKKTEYQQCFKKGNKIKNHNYNKQQQQHLKLGQQESGPEQYCILVGRKLPPRNVDGTAEDKQSRWDDGPPLPVRAAQACCSSKQKLEFDREAE